MEGPDIEGLTDEVAHEGRDRDAAGKSHDLLKSDLTLKEGARSPIHAKLAGEQNQRVAERRAQNGALGGLGACEFRKDVGDQEGAAVNQNRNSDRHRCKSWQFQGAKLASDENGCDHATREDRAQDLMTPKASATAKDCRGADRRNQCQKGVEHLGPRVRLAGWGPRDCSGVLTPGQRACVGESPLRSALEFHKATPANLRFDEAHNQV